MPHLILMLLLAGAVVWVAGFTIWTMFALALAAIVLVLVGLGKLLVLPFLAVGWSLAHPVAILLLLALVLLARRSGGRPRIGYSRFGYSSRVRPWRSY